MKFHEAITKNMITKINDNTIEEKTEKTDKYSPDELLKERKILTDRIAEIDRILTEAQKVGISVSIPK